MYYFGFYNNDAAQSQSPAGNTFYSKNRKHMLPVAKPLITTTTAGIARGNGNPVALVAMCLLLTGAVATPVFAQGFGSVTPGGVQPNLERQQAPRENQAPQLEIPAVPDRPLGESDGPRLAVKRFQLQGVEDTEGTGISQQDLNSWLEKVRVERPEGFTIGELQALADEITRIYRQNGFILALAFVPQQEITDGTVTISVLPGELGQVSVVNNSSYSDALLMKPAQGLVGEAVQLNRIESALLRVNDYPGLTVSGVFRPGSEIGETELVINTREEDPLEFTLIADDYGVETTGEQRLIASVTANNPLGFGDKLTITALQTFDPEDSTYGAINYESLLWRPDLLAGISYSLNDYAISQSLGFIETEGETEIVSVYGKFIHTRNRRLNITAVVDLSTKHAEIDFTDFTTSFGEGEDKLTVISAGVDADSVDSWMGGGLNEFSLFYSLGIADFLGSMDKDGDGESLRFEDLNATRRIGGDFQKLAFSFQRLQLVDPSNVLLLRLEGQATDDLLSSIEQFAMGGPNSVRAYPVAEYLRDTGLFASAEWIINAPGFSDKRAFNGRTWGEVLTVSLFLDYAFGRSNNELPASQSREQDISGAGIGLELRPADNAYFKFQAATPISPEDASNDEDPQLWFSAGIDF